VSGDIEIRRFRPADQDDVRRLILTGLEEHWGSLDPQYNHDLDDIGSTYRNGVTVVAVTNSQIVGTGTVVPVDPTGTAEMVRMAVARTQRRNGIGKQLIMRLAHEARQLDCQRLILETQTEWAEVLAFYERCGFVITHEVDGDFGRDTWFQMDL
jgi:putative acetyltransferase